METGDSRRSRCGQLVISLYFHIPFCSRKCPYCHFYVVPNKPLFHQVLTEGLKLEWETIQSHLAGKEITSIYFGGGTPALFPHGIGEILNWLKLPPDCEITVESNPEECTMALLQTFREMGVNRLSLGVQSLDDRALLSLERIHSASKAKEAIHLAKSADFSNVSIDLMYDLPDQTLASFAYTLEQVAELDIDHVSLYNLTIESHTAFYKRPPKQPAAEISLQLLEMATTKLEAMGLTRYEISAFAKQGKQSRHNLGYWTGRPFLGLGPSAFSFWEGERFRNVANLQRYTARLREGKSPIDFREALPFPQNINERLAVRLRLLEGAETTELPDTTLSVIEKLTQQGLLHKEGSHIQLTPRGLLLYDTVAAELI